MKKVLFLLITIMLLTGCGKVDKDKLVDDFIDRVESSKAYFLSGKMEIYNGEDTFSYDVEVSYMDDDYYKVRMVNSINSHEQIILKDTEAVYVVTPSLNKSYKFVSEWPYNSSQAYILNTLVKDIESDQGLEFKEEDDGYSLKTIVNYPNNNSLIYEKLYFDKDMNLKRICVYDKDDVIAIDVVISKIDYKANLSKEDFDINTLVDENCCNMEVETDDVETSALEDIIYPLYVPANTYLNGKELVSTEDGERVILTFNGEKNFVLIEEPSKSLDEFEIIPVYGDPLMMMSSIGALSSNSLSWSNDNVDYYLTSNDLSTEEILTIADSLNTFELIEK